MKAHNLDSISSLIYRTLAEGHGDHTDSVLRYRALYDAVNRYCDSETFRNIMDYAELAEERLFKERRRQSEE